MGNSLVDFRYPLFCPESHLLQADSVSFSTHTWNTLVNTAVIAHITDCDHVLVLLSLLSVLRLGGWWHDAFYSLPRLPFWVFRWLLPWLSNIFRRNSPTMSSPEDQFNFPAYDGRYFSGIPLSNLKELEGLIQLRIPPSVSSHLYMDRRLTVSSECHRHFAQHLLSLLRPTSRLLPFQGTQLVSSQLHHVRCFWDELW